MWLPSMSELTELGGPGPRVHPNGFIQLDLDEANRLHVWHPNLPYRQRTFHPVHAHIFDLQSCVYSGRLVHVEYVLYNGQSFGVKDSHVRWTAECIGGSDTVLRRTEDPACFLCSVNLIAVQPGEDYVFPAFRFHETLANEPTLTVMTKIMDPAHMNPGANCQGASIMVPVGVEPDNNFRRDAVDADVLWQLIEEAHPCA